MKKKRERLAQVVKLRQALVEQRRREHAEAQAARDETQAVREAAERRGEELRQARTRAVSPGEIDLGYLRSLESDVRATNRLVAEQTLLAAGSEERLERCRKALEIAGRARRGGERALGRVLSLEASCVRRREKRELEDRLGARQERAA